MEKCKTCDGNGWVSVGVPVQRRNWRGEQVMIQEEQQQQCQDCNGTGHCDGDALKPAIPTPIQGDV